MNYKIIPDILDEKTTRICTPPIPTDQSIIEGINVEKRCHTVYDESSRNEVLKDLKNYDTEWVHLSGGWRNPMTAEYKFFRHEPGDKPFNERTVGEYKQHLPIEFNYLESWKELAEKGKGKLSDEEFKKMKISELLKLGAPSYWDLKIDDRIIARTTNAPFPGTEFEMGYIVTELDPFGYDINISNTTGARGFGTIALNHLLTYLKHPEEKIKEIYIKEAEWRNEQSKSKRGKADAFIETAGSVKDKIKDILETYGKEAKGFQYACIIYVEKQIPAGIYTFPKSVPHAAIKTEEGWKIIDY